MSISSVTNVKCKDLLLWRLINAFVCNVLFQMIFLLVFLITANFNLMQPSIWGYDILNVLTSFSTWVHLVPISIITLAQGVICSKDYIYVKPYKKTRLLRFIGMFSLRNLAMLVLHAIVGSLMVWLYLLLVEGQYGLIYETCNVNKVCIREEGFFLLCNGLWIGFFYFMKDYLYSRHDMLFSIIQQNKLITIKLNISKNLKEAMIEAIWPTIYFMSIYFYRGINVRNWFFESFDLTLPNADRSFSILDFKLILYSWGFSAMFIFTILCMKLFYKVILSEHWKFPIETTYPDILTLKDAYEMKNLPIVQQLACLDLHLLSLWDFDRRKQIFALSIPGGHPHNWNKLLEQILIVINEYTGELNKCIDSIICPDSPTKPKEPVVTSVKEVHNLSTNIINQELLYDLNTSQYGLRNMSLPRPEPMNIIEVKRNYLVANLINSLKQACINRYDQFVATLQKKYLINYVFGDLPESRIYYLLSTGQPVILTVQGISQLVTTSFKEDVYGVVQKDLPVIITTLVHLKQSLDKLSKITVSKKHSTSDQHKMQLKLAIRTAVKRSLYNICNTFGEYMSQVQLSKDVQAQVHSIITYREG